MDSYLLPYAKVTWQSTDTPFAPEYDDIYWSSSGGLAEKQHVFIEACELPERWARLQSGDQFAIAELGFGFGLNFLLTLKAWQTHAPAGAKLNYVAYEKHLVAPADMALMAQAFQLNETFAPLRQLYPLPLPGTHVLHVSDNCDLTLVIGDANETLTQLKANLDAVFLDGFSPSRNQTLWSARLLGHIARQMRPGALLSTYSVAGALRRELQTQDLVVTKPAGFGNKRQMLIARRAGDWQPAHRQTRRVAVIGAGLTGLFSAATLQRAGLDVTVFDQTGTALGAVKNIQQIAIYPQLSQTPQPYSNLYLRAFQYFVNHQANQPGFHQCGRLELLDSDEKWQKAEQLNAQLGEVISLKSPQECSELLGFKVSEPGLFNPKAGWLAPQQLSLGATIEKARINNIVRQDAYWHIQSESGSKAFDVVLLATGAAHWPQLAPLGLLPLRGQSLTLVNGEMSPKCVLSWERTWFPGSPTGSSTLSGTYSRNDPGTDIRDADTVELLNALKRFARPTDYVAQVGIRAASRDRLPILGPIPDWQALQQWLQQHTDLKRAAENFREYQPGLYCSVGFGSHAGTLGPYCAEVLTRIISDDLQTENMRQLSSVRFAARDAAG
jgi:tRNA 5-methylaminomethyl-2-thiouridine biosynthesis bifunctional protein